MRPDCHACPVRRQGLCVSASDEQLSELGAIKLPLRQVRAGAPVFLEGDACDMVYVVRRGWAVASTLHENGRRQVLRFVVAGNLVGFETAGDGSMPCTVEALTDLVLCPLPRQRLVRLCESVPTLALRMASLLAAETISDWRLLGGLGTCNAEERIARLLLALHSRHHKEARNEDGDIVLPVSQTLIAEATGLTAVHVCRTLKDMRAAGLLAFSRGHLQVMDWRRVIDLAGVDDARRPMPGNGLPGNGLPGNGWAAGPCPTTHPAQRPIETRPH